MSAPAVPRVTVLSRETARHSAAAPSARSQSSLPSVHRLGPLDHTFAPFIPISVVFVYASPVNGSNGEKEVLPLSQLRVALGHVLDSYPHLTGRLAYDAASKAPEVRDIGAGALLLAAQCDQTLESFCAPSSSSSDEGLASEHRSRLRVVDLPGGGNELLAPFPNDWSIEGCSQNHLFTVQHTVFACGGVALGMRMLHVLCDADGFFQFARDLAELCRRLKPAGVVQQAPLQLQHPPVTRSFMDDLAMTDEERLEALQFKPTLFMLSPKAMAPCSVSDGAEPAAAPLSPPPTVSGRVLHFSAQELAALKAEANEGMPAGSEQLTTFDALSGHLWQSVYRARLHVAAAQGMTPAAALEHVATEMMVAINCRGAARLDLPERYFSNAIFSPSFGMEPKQLAQASLGMTAAAVHNGVRKLGKEEALQTLRWIAAQPDKRRVRVAFNFARGGFFVSQWSRIDMYAGMALGDSPHSAPVLVSTPFPAAGALLDGFVYLLPAAPKHGSGDNGDASSQDVNLALSDAVWSVLDKDERFRRHRKL